MIIRMSEKSTRERYALIISSVVPRPIAFVSTLSKNGVENLAPFSFFNGVCAKPPLVSIAIARKSGAVTKDTLRNIEETGELVINLVTEAMAEPMVMTAGEWPADVSEFDKAGFERLPSEVVKPPRVKGSPVTMECRVHRLIPVGDDLTTADGGTVSIATLVLAEILVMHVDDAVMSDRGVPDAAKLAPLARLGGLGYAGIDRLRNIARPEV